jgi:hypothetical protein
LNIGIEPIDGTGQKITEKNKAMRVYILVSIASKRYSFS